jgi:hypothetical protein
MGLCIFRPFCICINKKYLSDVSSSVIYVHNMFGLLQDIGSFFVKSGFVK